ncbi:MAG: M14 family zinc carboxypeptidase [Planctomycetota bacterium]
MVALLIVLLLAEDNPFAPDTPETGSVEQIRAFTTDAKYLPDSVAYVPASATVPSPTAVLGHLAGAPGELSDTATVHKYFRALDRASPRLTLRTIGKSEEGREILLAVIADETTLTDLDRFRGYTRALSDPRQVSKVEMEQIVASAKPIYYLNGGLHSPETGSPEMLMELAYRLAVSERAEIRRIRERVIVLINPVSEPDGRDRVVQWFYRYQKGKTDFEQLARGGAMSPPYWGHYIFHDNNRDGIQLTAELTHAVERMYWDFYPTVIHDLHESLPLLYIMTGHGPYSEAIDPVTIAEWSQFALHEVSELQAQGLPGVWTWGFWDGWWPGYLFAFANNHNAIGRFYETFGNLSAETFARKMQGSTFVGKEVTEKQWYRTWPPDKKLTWSLRDNTNYMEAGVLHALDYAALHGDELLRNFWIKGKRALERGRSEAPYAWLFRDDQADRGRLCYLINQLLRHRIEVQRAHDAFKTKEGEFPAGTLVVRMDQPYRNCAYNLLKVQEFPKDEPNLPYDDVAWTLPLLYGVDGTRIDDRTILDVAVDPVSAPLTAIGEVRGEGVLFLLKDTGQEALFAAREALRDASVDAIEQEVDVGGEKYPPGSWVVSCERARLERVAEQTGLTFTATADAPPVSRHPLDLPRLAVYHNWLETQDAGWVRYTLDQAHIQYTYINDDAIKAGKLHDRFDVILVPNTVGDLRALIHGIDATHGPIAYTRTDACPAHGTPDGSADITGGFGFAGMSHLEQFLADGGVLITLADASVLAVDGGLVHEVDRFRAQGLYTPGSEVRARFRRPSHPIAYGYPETTSIFRGNGSLFTVDDADAGLVVLQFGTGKPKVYGEEPSEAEAKETPQPLCLSGIVKGEELIATKPAILDVPVGRGRVVLFAFNPLHRFLNHSDFRLAYNAIMNWNDLGGASR